MNERWNLDRVYVGAHSPFAVPLLASIYCSSFFFRCLKKKKHSQVILSFILRGRKRRTSERGKRSSGASNFLIFLDVDSSDLAVHFCTPALCLFSFLLFFSSLLEWVSRSFTLRIFHNFFFYWNEDNCCADFFFLYNFVCVHSPLDVSKKKNPTAFQLSNSCSYPFFFFAGIGYGSLTITLCIEARKARTAEGGTEST